MPATFRDWYEKHKERLSEQRKLRYRQDPHYRENAIRRAAEYRQRVRGEKKAEFPGLTISQVCDLVGISPWTLNTWRVRGYYPIPRKEGVRPVFEHKHVELLRMIKQFFDQCPKRMVPSKHDDLMKVVDIVHHNWS